MNNIFTGFSTLGSDKKNNFKMHDVELVRQDLYNHFHTRIGERVMRPEYGCRIWDYVMEPFTEEIRQLTEEEVNRICESEPRVVLMSKQIISEGQSLLVVVTLDYKPFDVMETLTFTFEARQREEF